MQAKFQVEKPFQKNFISKIRLVRKINLIDKKLKKKFFQSFFTFTICLYLYRNNFQMYIIQIFDM